MKANKTLTIEIENKLSDYLNEYCNLLQNEIATELAQENANHVLNHLQTIIMKQPKIKSDQLRKSHVTKSGLVIDLIVMDRSLAFILLDKRNYCREPFVMTGETDFQIRMMEKVEKLKVIKIDSFRWDQWSDVEKELFIQNEIDFVLNK